MADKKKDPKKKTGSRGSPNTGIIKDDHMVKYGTIPQDVSPNSK